MTYLVHTFLVYSLEKFAVTEFCFTHELVLVFAGLLVLFASIFGLRLEDKIYRWSRIRFPNWKNQMLSKRVDQNKTVQVCSQYSVGTLIALEIYQQRIHCMFAMIENIDFTGAGIDQAAVYLIRIRDITVSYPQCGIAIVVQ